MKLRTRLSRGIPACNLRFTCLGDNESVNEHSG